MSRSSKSVTSKTVTTLLGVTAVLVPVMIYHRKKTLPEGLSYAGGVHQARQVKFLYNITYYTKSGELKHELPIYDEMEKMIGEAKQLIIADLFLFHAYRNGDENLPKVTERLTSKIIEQQQKYPSLRVVFITDPLNTGYHSCKNTIIEQLKNNGIQVILTDLSRLRDPNPLYSACWRIFFEPFGWKGTGWLPNPLAASDAPKVTMRAYLEMLNVKANHRKVLATERAALITSANPNDAGGFFANIGFKVEGDVVKDIVAAEEAVANYSSSHFTSLGMDKKYSSGKEAGGITIQYVTEEKIRAAMLEELEKAGEGDTIWLGALYISEHMVITKLVEAAGRGASIRMLLDPNKRSFNRNKHGLPNRVVAGKLIKRSNGRIHIRWFRTPKEQYHTKLLYIDKQQEGVLMGGSANFTARSLSGFNLESHLLIKAANKEQVMVDVEQYFRRLWHNEAGIYTADYHFYDDKLNYFRLTGYYLQKLVRYTTY